MLAFFLLTAAVRATITLAPSQSRTHTVYTVGFGDQPISLDLASSIISTSSDVTFSFSGAPSGTGLQLSSDGDISGTPSPQDLAAKQPLLLTVQASSSDGSSVSFPVMISLIASTPANYVSEFTYIGSPVNLDTTPSLNSATAPYTCSATGLPAGSGLKVDPTTCALSGTPNNADFGAKQPLRVSITATSQQDSTTANVVYIVTIMQPRPSTTTTTPTQQQQQPQQQQAPAQTSGSLSLAPSASHTHTVYQLAVVGHAFNFDLSKQVIGTGSFSLQGLPTGSGLSLTPAGMLAGTPKAQDAAAPQPLEMLVTATSPADGSSVSFPLMLSVIADPKVTGMYSIFASEGGSLGYDLSKSFGAITQPTFSSSGFPQGSGLSFNTATGELSGALNGADLQAPQPLQLMLTATSADQQQSTTIDFIITVLPVNAPAAGASAAAPSASTSASRSSGIQLAPSQSHTHTVRDLATVGEPFNLPLNAYFTGEAPVSITVAGLPAQSGLSVVKTTSGVTQLSGTPNAVDAAQPQPLILIAAAYAQDGSYAIFPIYLAVTGQPLPSASVNLFVAQGASLNGVDDSTAFTPTLDTLNAPVSFSVTGLPTGTGIVVDGQTGGVSGTPNAADYAAHQPLVITITATDVDGQASQAQVILFITPSAAQAPVGKTGVSAPTSAASTATTSTSTSTTATKPSTPSTSTTTTTTKTTTAPLLPYTPVVVRAVGVAKSSVISPTTLFSTLQGPITLSGVSGLPTGTGISIAADGTVSGTPTVKDQQAKQPIVVTVTGTAADGTQKQALIFVLVLAKAPVPLQVTGAVGKVGTPLRQVMPLTSAATPLKFSIAPAFPQGSGLKFDASKGVLSGTPTAVDLAKQPQQYVITTTDATNAVKRLAVLIPVVSANFPATA